MKILTSLELMRVLLIASCTVLTVSICKADSMTYQVEVNTASLVGNANGPFYLDFQLNDGSGTLLGVNTATLTNFTFIGGGFTGSATLLGGATGSLGSSVSLTDAAVFSNEFYQAFTASTSRIDFTVNLTSVVDPGLTPDAFVMAILDKNQDNIQTNDPSFGDSLMLVNINKPTLSLSDVQTFSSTSPAGVTLIATPEPSNLGILMAAGLLVLGWRSLLAFRSRKTIGTRKQSTLASTASVMAAAILAIFSSSVASAQSDPLFAAGNLVVSRSTYTGVPGTVLFPGSLPNNAASTADGAFPNVFLNETPDGSFGVTSPIFVDHITRGGGLINTIPVTSLIFTQLGKNVVTSFPSKSELGLNLTPDGKGVTFMAYGAAANQLDVSNSNTPGHVDITNPVNGQGVLISQRDIVELNASGATVVTTTNGYSGNNGRNVVLGLNGNYYTVGNAGNNGSSTTYSSGVTLTNGSNVVMLSATSTTANMYVGAPFSGTNIPIGAYVTSIASPTQFTISVAATGAASGSYIANDGAYQLAGISFTTGNTTITMADTLKLVPGMPLSGTGFAAGSYIASITNSTQFVASAPPTGNSNPAASSYTASVSNSMLSDNTGVRMIQKGANDTVGTGTGILDAVNNSTVVGKVNGTFGTTPGYQRGFAVTQLGVVLNGTTASGNPTITGLSPSVAAETANNVQLYGGLPVTGTGIPSSTTVLSIDSVANTVTLSKNATASGTVALTFAPAADKSGKDDNFRGITNYNNTLYITKGSGGNGFDAVYQVNPLGGAYVPPGTSAGLPTAANASSASINPLPGWPTGSTGANEGKNNGTIVHHPFGLWFANDTTLYVADEGAASVTNAAPGGLEKWIYNPAGKWELKYTLAASAIPSYSSGGLNLQALGLRNIAGIDNHDGTVTIYGITSTTGQTLNDEGADPNQLVAITDILAATSMPPETFLVIETAAYADALRGVVFIPGLAVTRGGFARDRRTGLFVQQVTIQNFGSSAVSGPLYLELDNLSPNATLTNKTGSDPNPYILIPTDSGLAVGASATVSLQFSNSNPAVGITYSTQVLTNIAP